MVVRVYVCWLGGWWVRWLVDCLFGNLLGSLWARNLLRDLQLIVFEALGELVEVCGGSRIGQEGLMSTKCCACPRLGASQEAISAPVPAPVRLQDGSGGCPQKRRVRF